LWSAKTVISLGAAWIISLIAVVVVVMDIRYMGAADLYSQYQTDVVDCHVGDELVPIGFKEWLETRQ